MNLPEYRDVPFDYEDFINDKILQIEYNLIILEYFGFMNEPSYNKNIIRECNIALFQLKVITEISKEELDKCRIKRKNK